VQNGLARAVIIPWGKGERKVIIIGGKKYQYNGKSISKTLENKVSSWYILMAATSSNQNIHIYDILSTENSDTEPGTRLTQKQRKLRRENLTKKLQRFIKKNFNDLSPKNHSVQIVYNIESKNKETSTTTTREYITDVFHVNGGKYKLRKAIEDNLYDIQQYMMDKYEITLLNMKIKRLYVDDVIKDIQNFDEIKMFGTVLNLCGYDLTVGHYEYTNACCVEYHVEMFNKIRHKNWTNERFMSEVGMKQIDEGVSLKQLIPLYKKYRIGFHIVDFKYHHTRSHHDYGYEINSKYLRLFYMIEGNHLYPIIDKRDQHSLSQIKAGKGKYQRPTHPEPTERDVKIFSRPEEILEMLGLYEPRTPSGFTISIPCNLPPIHVVDECKTSIFVSSNQGCVNELFYQLLRRGKLYNKNVKSEHGRITQFNIDDMTIQENLHYDDVERTIDTLNRRGTPSQWIYSGQTIQRLSNEYYNKYYNKDYKSEMSPQLMDVFDSKLSKNTGFNITLSREEATRSYDFNKLYSFILRNCGSFGWCRYTPTDEVRAFRLADVIETGFYYIETDNVFPCRGNGWYCDSFINEILQMGIITKDDIKYQIKSSNVLPNDFFQEFVDDVASTFSGYKLALNGFIGILSKMHTTNKHHYFTQDRNTALSHWLRFPKEYSFMGIYDTDDIYNYCLSDTIENNTETLQSMIDRALNKAVQPMAWMVNKEVLSPQYNNGAPIQRKIYDIANLMVYKKHMEITRLNPRAELVRIKTDLLGYVGISPDRAIETDDTKWGEVKIELSAPKPGELFNSSDYNRNETFEMRDRDWVNHEREVLSDDDIQSIIETGGLIHGMAGVGKSTALKKVRDTLQQMGNKYLISAFTHKACDIVDGTTFHKTLGIDIKTGHYDYMLIKSYKDKGLTHILIDEVSMIPSFIWNILAHIVSKYGFTIIGCGDWEQLPPVEEEHIDFKNTNIVKSIFKYKSYELTKVWRFSEDELLQDAYRAVGGQDIGISKYSSIAKPLSLCFSNDMVNAVNNKWNTFYSNQHSTNGGKILKVQGFDYTEYYLHKDLVLMAYKTHGKYVFTNSQELTVKDWSDHELTLVNAKGEEITLEMKYTASFKPRYAMTVHKSQGSTFTEDYSIYERENMSSRMLYVALTRARKKEQINFCSRTCDMESNGYIYSYEYNGRYYIGSTRNLNKRKQEHRNGNKCGPKFKQAIEKYGFDNFKFRVLQTIRFNNIRELWRLEDTYIRKYNSIDNGCNVRINKIEK
jgi:hypothetical protein